MNLSNEDFINTLDTPFSPHTANIYCQFTAVLLSKGGTVPPMTVHCQWRYDYRHFLVTIQLMTVGITLSSCN